MTPPVALPAQRSGRRLFGVPLVVALFFFAMMFPTSFSISLGGLRLSLFRVLLIVMFIPMLYALLGGRKLKANIFDALILGHAAWALLALINWGGIAQGVESGGIYIIECVGAYLVGRVYIRGLPDFTAFAKLFVASVSIMLIFTLPEALTGNHFLYNTFAAATGAPSAPYIDKRMGLSRAFGTFDHPILYGVFSAAGFSMAYFMLAERRLTNVRGMSKVLAVAVATFLSASGGPYLVLVMQVFTATWERVLTGIQGRWKLLLALFTLVYLWIDLMTTRTPFHVFITYFTFSAQSSYNRILIFTYGTAEVARHPFLGIGLGDWVRPPWMSDSMDNFWLLIAVRYGLPALFMLLGLLIGLVVAIANRPDFPAAWRNARHAWAFTLFGMAVVGGTVHLQNALFVLFMFMLGAGVWMYDTKPETPGRTRPATPPRPAAPPQRLF
jgi:hypothetical protein